MYQKNPNSVVPAAGAGAMMTEQAAVSGQGYVAPIPASYPAGYPAATVAVAGYPGAAVGYPGTAPGYSGAAPSYSNVSASYPPANQSEARSMPMQDEERAGNYTSTKICKIAGKDKFIDFSSKLTKALPQDFANIHGSGGKGHAPNSTITICICDYSKGTGSNSINVSYNVNVADIATLYEAAMDTRLGRPNSTSNQNDRLTAVSRQVLDQMRVWMTAPVIQNGIRAIPEQELISVGKALSDALEGSNQNADIVIYDKQKNNSYASSKQHGVETAPVSQIRITCNRTKRYPWTVYISNCIAPINRRSNGATTHNAKNAFDKKEAFISLSAEDFCAALYKVTSFMRLWEMRMFQVVDDGCTRYEQGIEKMRKNKLANQEERT